MGKLYQEVLFGHAPVLWAGCYASPYDRIPFLVYLTLWWATITFEFNNRTDAGGPSLFGPYSWKFHAVPAVERLRLYVSVHGQSRDYEPCRAL